MNAKNLAILVVAAISVMLLNACSATSNGSAPAAAVTSCTLTPTGQYVDNNGNICNPNTTTTTCPANGQAYLNGQYIPCTPGQPVYPSGYNYPTPNSSYPYSGYPQGTDGCSMWTQEYGQPYVPIYMNGSLVCANYYDLISQMQSTSYYSSYYQSTPYYSYGPQYYYAYPPYSSSGGGGCGVGIAFSTDDFGAALCF